MNSHQADIGVVGLAVMGENLILNMERNGFTVACHNRTVEKIDAFLNGRGQGKKLIGCHSPEILVKSLKRPRKIMLMVRAGRAIDALIASLQPLLDPGDIIIDGGNSFYEDTSRRCAELEKSGILFVGAGVSGGEEGALNGPSIMPGGNHKAWESIKPVFQSIAARAKDGAPCCEWIGPAGSGHFVKMVHNGIEYGDMQLISEGYHLLQSALGLSAAEMADIFGHWNQGDLNSYLIEITADILRKVDESGERVVDQILDVAGQKGTGKWTSQAGLELGVAIPQITAAVYARSLSVVKEERLIAADILSGPLTKPEIDADVFKHSLPQALYAAKICSYAQGFALMKMASDEFAWSLDFAAIARMWREGCIIRAAFLDKISDAYIRKPGLANLMLDGHFAEILKQCQTPWRYMVEKAVALGVPVPALGNALMYYDSYRCSRLPANLIQAQRDYFGAHTYEKTKEPRGTFFHTDWTGSGGATSSSTYNA